MLWILILRPNPDSRILILEGPYAEVPVVEGTVPLSHSVIAQARQVLCGLLGAVAPRRPDAVWPAGFVACGVLPQKVGGGKGRRVRYI